MQENGRKLKAKIGNEANFLKLLEKRARSKLGKVSKIHVENFLKKQIERAISVKLPLRLSSGD